MSKKAVFGIVAAALLVLALAAALLSSATLDSKGTTISQKVAVPSSFSTAIAYNKDVALFVYKDSLALYDLKSGNITQLSANIGDEGLANVHSLSVSADKKYVLFRNELATTDGLLYKTLQQAGLSTGTAYWWIFDASTSTFRPVPQPDAIQVRVEGDRLYALAASGNGTAITTYRLADMQQTAAITTPAANDFFLTPAGFLLQTTDNKVFLTKDGIVSRMILNNTVISSLTADKKHAIGLSTTKKTSSLVDISTKDWTTTSIDSSVFVQPAWLNNTALYFINQGSDDQPNNLLLSYNYATGATSRWQLDDNAKPGQGNSYTPQALFSDTSALVSDNDGNYYIIGNKLHTPFPQ